MLLSIMNVQLLFEFVLIFETIAIETELKNGDPCITPNQEEATCILFSNCKIIAEAIATYHPEARTFAQKSQCGFENNQGLVCCGSSAFLKFDFQSLFTQRPMMLSTTPAPPMEKITLSTFSSESVCGLHSNTSYRIKGGKATKLDEFPWMAALEYKSGLDNTSAGIQCGGSVINDRYILTAAHCINDIELVVIKAWLGVTNISSDDNCISITDTRECADSVQKFNIEKTITHKLYNRSEGYHDIGLLRLEKKITFTDYIRPICLLSPNSPSPRIGTYMTVAGWGLTGAGEHKSSQVKLKVEVPVMNSSFCNEILQGKTILSGQICAGGEKDKDSCQGDSGGPLMKDFTNAKQVVQWYQEGIVSLGVGCGIERRPAVYTRVSTYVSWIVSNVAERKMDEIPLSSLSDESICGLQGINSFRIKGGTTTQFDEFPWLAALEYESKFDNQNAGIRCGGSVINNRYILTAAHCIEQTEFVVIKAWLGVTNISSDANCINLAGRPLCINSTLKVNIEKAIPHSLYNGSHGYNDIGLLRLENQIAFTNYIRPICLPSPDLPSPDIGVRMTISGWGFTENHERSKIKLKVDIPVQNDNICNELLEIDGRAVGSGQICAGGEKGQDACQGDDGGPLMKDFINANEKIQWYQEGIVSYGIGCGIGHPAVFTRVARYVPWMISTIDELKVDKSAGSSLTNRADHIDIKALASLLG